MGCSINDLALPAEPGAGNSHFVSPGGVNLRDCISIDLSLSMTGGRAIVTRVRSTYLAIGRGQMAANLTQVGVVIGAGRIMQHELWV